MKSTKKQRTLPPRVAKRVLRVRGASIQIAKMAGVSRSFVSEVLHGAKPPSERIEEAIIEYFGRMAHETTFELAAQAVREEMMAGPRQSAAI